MQEEEGVLRVEVYRPRAWVCAERTWAWVYEVGSGKLMGIREGLVWVHA